MATAKKTTAKAPAKTAAKTTTAMVKWDEEMANAAKRGASVEKPTGGFASISLRGGIMAVDGTAVPDNELDVVVIAFAHENQYYSGAFDANNPVPPDCYAFGDLDAEDPESGMAPHEKVKEKQGDDNGLCANCWANAMGSDPTPGRKGKACKNVRRLLVVTSDALESADDLKNAEMRMLKVPVMSTRGWGMYVHKLADEMKRPVWGAVTRLKVVPDLKAQFKITFNFENLVQFDQELYEAMQSKINEAKISIVGPYPDYVAPEQAVRPPPSGRPQRGAPAAKQSPAAKARPVVPIVPVRGAPAAKQAAGGQRKPKY